jgi:hypothetical protein
LPVGGPWLWSCLPRLSKSRSGPLSPLPRSSQLYADLGSLGFGKSSKVQCARLPLSRFTHNARN